VKKYTIKLYDKAGTTFKGVLGQLDKYSFSMSINSGMGDFRMTIPENDNIDLLDGIELWVQDEDTAGLKIYSGYISSIQTNISGDKYDMDIKALGYASRLAFTLDWDGAQAKMERTDDPTDIVKDIIDYYRANVDNERINYVAGSTEDAGYSVTYVSESKLCIESLEAVRLLAGEDFYWFIDADNTLYWKAKPTTPTHKFKFQKDITEIHISKDVNDIVNSLVFWNGLQDFDDNVISKLYYTGAGVTAYWDRFKRLTESGITTEATADKLGEAYIEANKEPNISLWFIVKDGNLGDGYDIESVKPGDTCAIRNFEDEDIYSGNLLITKVDYNPDYIKVYVEDKRALTGRVFSDVQRSIESLTYGDGVEYITLEDVD